MSDIAERVKKIVVEHLSVDEAKVTESASFIDDLGADSLDTVELVMAFEEEFGIEIPDDAAETIQTYGDAVKFIEANATRLSARGSIPGGVRGTGRRFCLRARQPCLPVSGPIRGRAPKRYNGKVKAKNISSPVAHVEHGPTSGQATRAWPEEGPGPPTTRGGVAQRVRGLPRLTGARPRSLRPLHQKRPPRSGAQAILTVASGGSPGRPAQANTKSPAVKLAACRSASESMLAKRAIECAMSSASTNSRLADVDRRVEVEHEVARRLVLGRGAPRRRRWRSPCRSGSSRTRRWSRRRRP